MDGAPNSPYRLTVHLTALDHLAEGLYSSVAAVLTETVAEAVGGLCLALATQRDVA